MSHNAAIILFAFPLLGLAIMAVALFALGMNRERWIVPGVVAMMVAVASFSLAMEYGGRVRVLIADSIPGVEKPAEQGTWEEPDVESEPTQWPEDTEVSRARKKRPPDASWDYEDDSPRWIPADGRPDTEDRESPRSTRRRTVVVNPVTDKTRTRRRETRTVTPTPPQPTPKPPKAVPPTPKPTPTPEKPPPRVVMNQPREVTPPPMPPLRQPAPARSSGKGGVLVIKIKGPLLETSKNPARTPHLLIILDGRQVEIKPPNRSEEQHQDENPSGPLLAVTYFWENLTITFSDLDPGWHMVMIDTSLDSPRSHQALMTNPNTQGQNDWNGTVEIKAGQTTVIEFGTKNWLNGQLTRIR